MVPNSSHSTQYTYLSIVSFLKKNTYPKSSSLLSSNLNSSEIGCNCFGACDVAAVVASFVPNAVCTADATAFEFSTIFSATSLLMKSLTF